MTAFQIVYSRLPPTLKQFLPGEIQVEEVARHLTDRKEAIHQLRHHLLKAKEQMTVQANKHGRHIHFNIGDKVLLKIRPHRQLFIANRLHPKLAVKYFGPFDIIQQIGPVAYKLLLPPSSRIHPVFHVSQLKPLHGDHPSLTTLPPDFGPAKLPFVEPETVLQHHNINRNGLSIPQVLLKWQGRPCEETTWMDTDDVLGQLPTFSLEDKVVLQPQGNVKNLVQKSGPREQTPRPHVWKVYKRREKKLGGMKEGQLCHSVII